MKGGKEELMKEMKKMISEREKEVDKLKKQYDNQGLGHGLHLSSLSQKDQEIRKLRMKFDEEVAVVKSSSEEREKKLMKLVRDLRNGIDEKEAEIRRIGEELKKAMMDSKNIRMVNQTVLQAIEKRSSESKALEAKCEEMKEIVVLTNKKIKNLKDLNESYVVVMEEKKRTIQKLTDEKKEVEDRNRFLEEKLLIQDYEDEGEEELEEGTEDVDNDLDSAIGMASSKNNQNMVDIFGASPLHYAVGRGDLEEVKKLVSTGKFDPLAIDGTGNTPISIAALLDHEEIVDFLVSKILPPMIQPTSNTEEKERISSILRRNVGREDIPLKERREAFEKDYEVVRRDLQSIMKKVNFAPDLEFIPFPQNDRISILVLGREGSGKSTFIHKLVSVLLSNSNNKEEDEGEEEEKADVKTEASLSGIDLIEAQFSDYELKEGELKSIRTSDFVVLLSEGEFADRHEGELLRSIFRGNWNRLSRIKVIDHKIDKFWKILKNEENSDMKKRTEERRMLLSETVLKTLGWVFYNEKNKKKIEQVRDGHVFPLSSLDLEYEVGYSERKSFVRLNEGLWRGFAKRIIQFKEELLFTSTVERNCNTIFECLESHGGQIKLLSRKVID